MFIQNFVSSRELATQKYWLNMIDLNLFVFPFILTFETQTTKIMQMYFSELFQEVQTISLF